MSYELKSKYSTFLRKSEQGLSLIEASMVLALSAIVISGVMVYYQSASENNKLKELVLLYQGAISTVNALYENKHNYNSVEDVLLLNSSAINSKYKVNNKLTTPFGGTFRIEKGIPADTVAGNIYSYRLFAEGIPSSSCITLMTFDFGPNQSRSGVSSARGKWTNIEKNNVKQATDLCSAKSSLPNSTYDVLITIDKRGAQGGKI